MTNKILALVDGSAYSKSVCHHTAWIAGRLNADVDVMHVLGPREGGAPRDLSGAIGLGARSALLEELARADEQRARLAQAHGRAILEDSEAILRAQNVGTIKVHLRKGDILEAVRQAEWPAPSAGTSPATRWPCRCFDEERCLEPRHHG